MVVILEGGCRVSTMHDGEPVVNGTLRIWSQVGRSIGAQAISLRVMEFASGLSPGIRNDDCDEILYVLDNNREAVEDTSQGRARNATPLDHVSLHDSHPEGRRRKGNTRILINGHPSDIGPDTGIYIHPGETFGIQNPGPESIVIISPDPDRAPEFVPSPMAGTDSVAPNRSPIVRLADRPAQPTADRWYRVLVDDEVGSTQATQFVGSIPPGRESNHFHQYEEVLFILKGEGRMWAGETNTPIAPGSCIYLPKGQVHCVENTRKGELHLLGVFYPAGSPSVRYEA